MADNQGLGISDRGAAGEVLTYKKKVKEGKTMKRTHQKTGSNLGDSDEIEAIDK